MREISTDKQYRKIYLHQKKGSINEIKHALVEQDVIRLLCRSTIWSFYAKKAQIHTLEMRPLME